VHGALIEACDAPHPDIPSAGPADALGSGHLPRALLSAIVESAPVALLMVDVSGRIRFSNRGAESMFGYPRGEMTGLPVDALVPESARGAHAGLRAAFFSEHSARRMGVGRELNAVRRDGSLIAVEVALEPLPTAGELFVVAAVVDVSERRRLEQRYQITVEAAPIAMIQCDPAGCIVMMNGEAERIFDYRRRELIGSPVDRLFPESSHVRDPEARRRFFTSPIVRRMRSRGRQAYGVRRDGTQFPIEIGLNPMRGNGAASLLLTIADITERCRLQEQLQNTHDDLERRVLERTEQLANANREKERLLHDLEIKRIELEQLSREDPLTGLANRRDFDRRLADALEQAQRLAAPLAAAMFDLDGFKRVNDEHGHALGDAVLQVTATLMRRECRAIDIVARYGGEEFVLAFPHTTRHDAAQVCERIRRSFEQFTWDRLAPGLAPTISAGVAGWKVGMRAADLLAAADANLYEAKRRGRNLVVQSTP
jgi:diguanylate cyclase (GGDEF)-like protein/PAS domain S-box-containing protein